MKNIFKIDEATNSQRTMHPLTNTKTGSMVDLDLYYLPVSFICWMCCSACMQVAGQWAASWHSEHHITPHSQGTGTPSTLSEAASGPDSRPVLDPVLDWSFSLTWTSRPHLGLGHHFHWGWPLMRLSWIRVRWMWVRASGKTDSKVVLSIMDLHWNACKIKMRGTIDKSSMNHCKHAVLKERVNIIYLWYWIKVLVNCFIFTHHTVSQWDNDLEHQSHRNMTRNCYTKLL